MSRVEIITKATMIVLCLATFGFLTYQLVRCALTGQILWMNKDGSFELITWAGHAWQFGSALFLFSYTWILVTLRLLITAHELRDLAKGVR
jgi:hypothetical protein